VPEPLPPEDRRPTRSADERALDHAAIDRLTAELLPSLIAKLSATGLGELEVREDAWHVRLRRPGGGDPPVRERATSDRGTERDRGPERSSRASQHHPDAPSARTESRGVATSPAVGVYRPRTDIAPGDRVSAGDRLGAVDMLGVAQEVVAPVDGVLGSGLAEPGEAVEYGQELLVIEIIPPAGPIGPADGSGGA
jgi:acetyl-CoA carboxylase biotin carboxyl carrier protein